MVHARQRSLVVKQHQFVSVRMDGAVLFVLNQLINAKDSRATMVELVNLARVGFDVRALKVFPVRIAVLM